MPPPFLKDTVDISVQLPPGTLSVDVAKYIFDYFAGKYTVKSIQQCPGRIARATFAEPEARVAVEELQRIDLNGVSCPIIVPMPPPPCYSFMCIFTLSWVLISRLLIFSNIMVKLIPFVFNTGRTLKRFLRAPVLFVWLDVITFRGLLLLTVFVVRFGIRVSP